MSESEGVGETLDFLVYRLGYVYLTDCFVKPCPSPCLGLLGSPSSRKSGIIKKQKKIDAMEVCLPQSDNLLQK